MAGRSWTPGHHRNRGNVSGNPPLRVVDLIGSSMEAVVMAIPEVATRTGRPVIIVGGLAVICRLSTPYRATIDLDTVNRRHGGEPAQLEVLLASPGATASGPAGALVPTAAGPVQVDVLEVSDADLSPLPDDPTDRLHVMSHDWAAATATEVIICAGARAGDAVSVEVRAAVAEPGPLVAMKLQSVMNRGRAKEATDLLDIIRLTLDPATGPVVREQLAGAAKRIRVDADRHAKLWFTDKAARTGRLVRELPQGVDIDPDLIALVSQLLRGALS